MFRRGRMSPAIIMRFLSLFLIGGLVSLPPLPPSRLSANLEELDVYFGAISSARARAQLLQGTPSRVHFTCKAWHINAELSGDLKRIGDDFCTRNAVPILYAPAAR